MLIGFVFGLQALWKRAQQTSLLLEEEFVKEDDF